MVETQETTVSDSTQQSEPWTSEQYEEALAHLEQLQEQVRTPLDNFSLSLINALSSSPTSAQQSHQSSARSRVRPKAQAKRECSPMFATRLSIRQRTSDSSATIGTRSRRGRCLHVRRRVMSAMAIFHVRGRLNRMDGRCGDAAVPSTVNTTVQPVLSHPIFVDYRYNADCPRPSMLLPNRSALIIRYLMSHAMLIRPGRQYVVVLRVRYGRDATICLTPGLIEFRL
jgi:hypothetical protein